MTLRALAVTLLVLSSGLVTPVAGAQHGPGTTTTVPSGVPSEGMIPRPDAGAAPEEAGDRGGALQLGLLALLVVAVGGIGLVLVRQARRASGGGG